MPKAKSQSKTVKKAIKQTIMEETKKHLKEIREALTSHKDKQVA